MNFRTKTLNFKKAIIIYGFLVLGIFLPLLALNAQTVEDRRNELKQSLEVLDAQIQELNGSIAEGKQQSATLQKEINILKNEAKKIELEIKQLDLAIAEARLEIDEKDKEIDQIEKKLSSRKTTLAEFLRKINEADQASLFEIVLSHKKFSDFFNKIKTEEEKEDAEEQKRQYERLRSIQGVKKSDLTEKRGQQETLLSRTKGLESEYKKSIVQKQKYAASIRSQLFLLAGSAAIPFEKALEYANVAFQKTGIRPAFLLGVFKVESRMGANVGKGNWREDLSHPRCASQRKAFEQITAELGLNPDLMPVSKRVVDYGYCGGAMGPAQFMPATWLGYKSKIAALSGHNPPNPWNPQDAFIAAALYLKNSGGLNNERTAALQYLAGGNWRKNPDYYNKIYGNYVMSYALEYQEQIEILQSLASR
ncbi:MAG: M23/M37 family peptidase [Candidatus Azambacteria bacterium GW2011_GWB2_46_37]|uniref:M23/M37 family peptidase n=2 Tax=Candidatus Azamiibacteriota TaxID=1752741 RepID=A0A0G1SW31_9BACT|nr:MAG: M23/M37 family peptidase [Candidatus Azambacteria bacterium GW2011_GWB2_46_37]